MGTSGTVTPGTPGSTSGGFGTGTAGASGAVTAASTGAAPSTALRYRLGLGLDRLLRLDRRRGTGGATPGHRFAPRSSRPLSWRQDRGAPSLSLYSSPRNG